jgi:hypothetical protein
MLSDSGWMTDYAEVILLNPTALLLPDCRLLVQNRKVRCALRNKSSGSQHNPTARDFPEAISRLCFCEANASRWNLIPSDI